MENTSCGDECPFVKNKYCSSCKECPNYLESWWTQAGQETPKLIKDCAPKRMLLQQQHMQLRLEQLQATIETQRVESQLLLNHIKALVDVASKIIVNDIDTIENKCNKLLDHA